MKLAIFNEAALIKPKSGHQFPQSPEDQELLPGVEGAIAALVEQGYVLAIASNQDGCSWQNLNSPKQCPIPVYVKSCDRRLISKYSGDQKTYFFEKGDEESVFSVDNNRPIEYRYKTIEDAIAEMQYCLKLIPQIQRCYFCPDIEGKICMAGDWRGFDNYAWRVLGAKYRKPDPGMLQIAIKEFKATEAIMIGDRPEDEQDEQAAGISFMWADEWRKPFEE